MVSPLNPLVGAGMQQQPIDIGGALAGGMMRNQKMRMGEQDLQMGAQSMQMNDQTMRLREQDQQQQVTREQYEMAVQKMRVMGNIAKRARQMPADQREAFAQSIDQDMLKSMGIDPQQVAAFPKDDKSLDELIAQTSALIPEDDAPANVQAFNSMTEGLSDEDREKARRIELGLAPRAVGSAAITTATQGLTDTVAGSQGVIAGETARSKEDARLDVQLEKLPGVRSAIAQAEADVEKLTGEDKLAKQNEITLNMFNTALDSLDASLANTTTGPIAGRMPAVTAGQQIAEGSVAAMAPILKSLFKVAGEGTFTDKDQELLTAMLPTRKDLPEAVAAKNENIKAIVRAKLGQSAEQKPKSKYTIEVM